MARRASRCLERGGGGGSVPYAVVGREGHVDVTKFLEPGREKGEVTAFVPSDSNKVGEEVRGHGLLQS
ncbi:uncharacterized protein M6B38_341770 [Iris pallida]|uniref:Uncharacterized protein n=1 Tax=Iris pallida TaxID=29817 RepID=A0AAX6GXL1_IRIPA|nr:uncharacterized protein M6B38_341770 [Iris pallida]